MIGYSRKGAQYGINIAKRCMRKWKMAAAGVVMMAVLGTSSTLYHAEAGSFARWNQAKDVFDEKQVMRIVDHLHHEKITDDYKSASKGIVKRESRFQQKDEDRMKSSGGTSGSGISKSGTYPQRKGMILVTGDYYKNLLPTGHAAIVYSKSQVVESLADGVVVGRNDWYSTKKTCYAGSVRSTSSTQDAAVADWCYKKRGTPYNYNYFNTSTRSKFYCSQLVYAGFLDNYGINLNTSDFNVPGVGNPVHPLELLDNDYTYVTYRQE